MWVPAPECPRRCVLPPAKVDQLPRACGRHGALPRLRAGRRSGGGRDRAAEDAAPRAARGSRRPDGRLRRLRHAGAVSGRHPEGAPAHPGGGRPLRRQPHGPDRAAPAVGRARRRGARRWRRLVPMDVLGLAPGRQRYALFTDDARRHPRRPDGREPRRPPAPGGQRRLQGGRTSRISRRGSAAPARSSRWSAALLALQGPKAAAVLARLQPGRGGDALHGRARASTRRRAGGGVALGLHRRGRLRDLARGARTRSTSPSGCSATPEVLPIGLGARDSLRLEAGLCLYGHDIDATTTPVEAALEWAIQPARRRGGARAGGFPGAEVILGQIAAGATRRRVGLLPGGAGADARGHRALRRGGRRGGRARSPPAASGRASTRRSPWATCRSTQAAPGTRLLGRLRGKMLPVTVAKMPFIEPGYKRA